MSADNTIFIRPMKNGEFRVKEIRSFYHEQMSDEEIDREFECDSEIAETEEKADEIAETLLDLIEESGGYVEYGLDLLPRKDLREE